MVALKTEILENNLNEEVGYRDFFRSFGFVDDSTLFFRTFYDPGKSDSGLNSQVQLDKIDKLLPVL